MTANYMKKNLGLEKSYTSEEIIEINSIFQNENNNKITSNAITTD